MCADCYAVLARQFNGGPHHAGISCVEAACDISGRYVREERGVVAECPRAERLTDVSIQIDKGGRHASYVNTLVILATWLVAAAVAKTRKPE
jgi:hypothetical protein